MIKVEKGEDGNWHVTTEDGYHSWSSHPVFAATMALRLAQEFRRPEPLFSADLPRDVIDDARRQVELLWHKAK